MGASEAPCNFLSKLCQDFFNFALLESRDRLFEGSVCFQRKFERLKLPPAFDCGDSVQCSEVLRGPPSSRSQCKVLLGGWPQP